MAKRSRSQGLLFACIPSFKLSGANANEIKRDNSPVVIFVLNHTRPCILIAAVYLQNVSDSIFAKCPSLTIYEYMHVICSDKI